MKKMKFKRIILFVVGFIVLAVIAGIIYGIYRQRSLSESDLMPQEGGGIPETNPFESEINPFDHYKNPFDSTQGEPFDSSSLNSDLLLAQVGASSGVSFPVAELGNCRSQQECRAFCEKLENVKSCIAFAEKHRLMSEAELKEARKFSDVGSGPGGCRTREECDAYCNSINHIEECVAFAEQHDVLPAAELAEARRISRYVQDGGQMPGGCNNKMECEAYCQSSQHMEECLDFGEKSGVIPEQELREARKVLPFIQRGETPGGCIKKEECDVYCSVPAHMEECLDFAERAGLIDPEELKLARKVVPLMVRGETPGKCMSKEVCESYCKNPAHFLECLDFAEKVGLMSRAEIMFLRRMIKLVPGM